MDNVRLVIDKTHCRQSDVYGITLYCIQLIEKIRVHALKCTQYALKIPYAMMQCCNAELCIIVSQYTIWYPRGFLRGFKFPSTKIRVLLIFPSQSRYVLLKCLPNIGFIYVGIYEYSPPQVAELADLPNLLCLHLQIL